MLRIRRRTERAVAFEAYGVQVEVVFSDCSLGDRVLEILPPGARECRPRQSAARFDLTQTGADDFEVTTGDISLTSDASLDVALGVLDQQMRLHIAGTARDWIFVHAGAVAVDGRAILLPGPSFSGKTTLVKSLVEAGATYLSDEYAVVDPAGRVHPYPRPLSIRSDDGARIREHPVAVFGGVAGDRAVDVALVAVVRYRPGAQWQPARISAGRGVTALLTNTVPAQDRPRESLSALKKAVAAATVLEGERGESAPAAEALLRELTQYT